MAGYLGAIPVPQATQNRESFTALANQTSFATAGYTVGFVDVFLNGVRLNTADFTATNGSDVVLGSGAAVNDILDVISYATFEINAQTFTGTTTMTDVVAASLDISGAIDVLGTTNLDIVDIDGAVNIATTALVTGILTTTATAVFNGGFTVDGNARIEELGAIAKLTLERGGSANHADSAAVDLLETNDGSEGANFADAATNGFRLKLDGSANDFLIQSAAGTSVNTRFGIDRDSGAVTISGATDIGAIGTSVAATLRLKSNSSHFAINIEENSGTEGWALGVDADGDLNFHNSGGSTPTVTFADSGFVGIQTTAPAAPLQVDSDNSFPTLVLSRDGGVSGRRPFGVAIGGNTDASMFINASNDTTGAGAFGSSRVILMELEAAGDVHVKTGNLVIGTEGKGISFAATGNGSGSSQNELLNDYEEGTWAATGNGITLANQVSRYVKVGNIVHIGSKIVFPSTSSTANATIAGFPFAAVNSEAARAGIVVSWHNEGSSNGLGFLVGGNVAEGTFYLGSVIKTNANMSGHTVFFGGTYLSDN